MVSAVITYQQRSALREIAKALGVPHREGAMKTTRASPSLSEEIHGFPRHLSIHSGGFTLSADPIIETVPIEPARMEGRTIVQWDKEDLAMIGLLKVDILALGMLTALQAHLRSCEDAQIRAALELEIATVKPDDRPTYEMIQNADTVGVFQIESRAQMSMLGRLQPKNFYDLVIQVAIVRPGPIVGQMVHPYLKRRRGAGVVESPHPKLDDDPGAHARRPAFSGAGHEDGDRAGGLHARRGRRAPARDQRLAIHGRARAPGQKAHGRAARERLAAGVTSSGSSSRSRGSRSTAFRSRMRRRSRSWLTPLPISRCHHPAEFTCALINSQPMGFYSNHTLVEDAKRHGVEMLPVHPNASHWDCVVEQENRLRLGLRVVNGLAKVDAEKVIAARPFSSVGDFLARTRLKPAVLQRLAMGEAFACFGLDQRASLWEVLGHSTVLGQGAAPVSGQGELFEKLSAYEAIHADFESYGLSARGHPMSALRHLDIPPTTTTTLRRATHGSVARLAGLVIVRQHPHTAKGTVFAALEDEGGFIDMILHRDIYEKYHDVFVNSPFQVVVGKVQRDGKTLNLVVQHIEGLDVAGIRANSHDFR